MLCHTGRELLESPYVSAEEPVMVTEPSAGRLATNGAEARLADPFATLLAALAGC